ncbi:MAG TPA: chromosomal replication initiator protein DnaA [Nitrospirae bacterium]|nr:chromosomal replication initiator protein DnaA [Nitrospirota bacterium]HDZ88228.1 chromosomal replication initiator protein DnaA [Nitrospirota bacterium]
MMDIEKTWHKGLSLIEEKLGDSIFELWFKPIKAANIKDGVLTLEVPNRFYMEWIQDNYPEIINDAMKKVSNTVFTIKYKFAESQDREIKQIQRKFYDRRKRLASKGIYLNPKYTFDSFVVGLSNEFAHAAAIAVSGAVGKTYNPLFIYGGVGLGKTHLINSIGNRIIDSSPEYNVIYVSAEQFTNEVVSAIRHNKMGEFKEKYRNTDLFLLDDVQFIAGKDRTQDEFFHTFNALYEKQKQIVISSDRPPREISDITDRLKSRFAMGLIADIQPPDVEMKVAILQKKAEAEKIEINDEVAYFLATRIKSNVRELEGSLIKLAAYSTLTGSNINLDMAKKILKDFIRDDDRPVTADQIQKAVCEFYGIRQQDMKTRKRTREIALPRQIAMYISKKLTQLSLNDIGKSFGGKDHATVIYACKQTEDRMNKDESFKRIVENLIGRLKP